MAYIGIAAVTSDRIEAATVVAWSGEDLFTTGDMTFKEIFTDQLNTVTGGSFVPSFDDPDDPTYTASELKVDIRLDSVWTEVFRENIDTKTLLSDVLTKLSFSSGYVSGIMLSSNIGLFQQMIGSEFEFARLSAEVPKPVPLPAALPLLGTGLGLIGFIGWLRRRRATATEA